MDGPILVTGGTGTLGRALVKRLHAAGHRPRVVSRHPGPGRVVGDLKTAPASMMRYAAQLRSCTARPDRAVMLPSRAR